LTKSLDGRQGVKEEKKEPRGRRSELTEQLSEEAKGKTFSQKREIKRNE